MKKIELCQVNGKGERIVKDNVWHTFTKWIPAILFLCSIIGFLLGKWKGTIIAGKQIELIEPAVAEVKDIETWRAVQTEKQIKTDESIAELKGMAQTANIILTAVQVGLARVEGKVDALGKKKQ